jgi:hypothetical protein
VPTKRVRLADDGMALALSLLLAIVAQRRAGLDTPDSSFHASLSFFGDQIMLWLDGPWVQGDRELYVAAGMQLWGENRITLEPTLTQPSLELLNSFKPNTLALYGKSMDAVASFWESIPQANQATTPIRYDCTGPADNSSGFPTTEGHTCLTTLTWAGGTHP